MNLHIFPGLVFVCYMSLNKINFIIFGRFLRCFGSSDLRFSLKLVHSNRQIDNDIRLQFDSFDKVRSRVFP